jgi:hypothetical protein
VDPVSKQRLLAGGQKTGALVRVKAELFGETINGITDADFPGGGKHEHGKHERLIIRNGHALNLAAAAHWAKAFSMAGGLTP